MAKHPSLPSLTVTDKEHAQRPLEPSHSDTKIDKTITLTRKEVFEASDPDNKCLIIIGSSIYDCTKWQNNHPGGHLTIRALCGKDATDAFDATHTPEIRGRLKGFYYGKLADENLSDLTVDFRRITKQLKDEGFFETDYTFYYKKIAAYACLFALVLAGVFLSDKLIVHALSGMGLGLFWQQVAFIGHDLGHNGITHDRIIDSYLGLFFGNFCTGIGIGWWKRGHNVHHIVTNSIEYDPDIQHLPLFAVTPEYLKKRVFSTWYNAYLHLNSLAHVLVRYQHWLYYPVMAFARFNLYAQSLTHAFGVGMYDKNEYMWKRGLQVWSLLGFHTWLIALTMSLPTWSSRIVFFMLAHNVAGILHIQITLSHFSMPTYSGTTYDGCDNGHLQTQLKGSLDVDCPEWLDWFHGGLQFQTPHHVWPRMPRHNLRKAQSILMSFCKQHGLEFNCLPFLQANYTVFKTLRETGKTTLTLSELFTDGFNLVG
mmetsp:Transcript_20635/g.25518  ORF Transcript_20635/g.25518 Transcript_20635/m.25518 type:complete len:482 (+) Transcript_20635:121-1566(+)|eukprot:CAMPEP_0172498780 /NCGR_PEP_ID=MMETSP1066-20121228/117307_1 /TAXON_ID=671091 /ORGANISM="Coscinodiscus wailesii, Strain CCMP2513" /LENGTH=481 /DNA_ID=CAMNT_0013272205 /DNA_START=90 /DNA_END=1535 /DNA_ORIENTATION=+